VALLDGGDRVFSETGLVYWLSVHHLNTASCLAPRAREGGRDESLFSAGRAESRRELGPDRASQSRVYLFVDDT
jgi:hypothetical protein